MKRHRTLLSVLLGLVLLVQGYAVSAAPHAKLSDAAGALVTAQVKTPCHAQQADMEDAAGEQQRPCCNVGCPDMTTCALGHIAAAAVMSVALPQAAHAEIAFAPVHAVSRMLSLPLRPPITLHG